MNDLKPNFLLGLAEIIKKMLLTGHPQNTKITSITFINGLIARGVDDIICRAPFESLC